MGKTFNLRVDAKGLTNLGVDLTALSGDQLGQSAKAAVNEVVKRTYLFARKDMNENINLTDAYIGSKVSYELAQATTNPTGTITTIGDLTPLDRFDARVVTQPVNWSNSRIQSLGFKFGPWPGWTRRKGDAARGIPENEKAKSVAVTVQRGAPKQLGSSAFRMKLKNGNGYGTFIRTSEDKTKHLYGPSPYSLFAFTVKTNQDRIADDLQSTALAEVTQAIIRRLSA